ncbi:glycosyltransferase [Jannaschia pohangensis]|uniref:Glycosyltransferase involved in cell wall bisynthesis n=1 Tax=Jannaschia pohangensis TaxID=390807 RepID=A0A1I3TL38_9RHOB|nr:glycosyltransferase [Jannaschia pohangensis]SFJ71099.1 Glycosyltransferase involved in cell wall bisynthesis [Jannaschia pohangensis]
MANPRSAARFLRNTFRPVLIRRFVTSLREEGWGMATAKARIYMGMRLRGEALSSLAPSEAGNREGETLHGSWLQLAQGGGFHVSSRRIGTAPRLALIGDLNLPQCRKYRVEQLADFWRDQGVYCEFAHYQDIPRALRLMSTATHLMEYRLPVTPLTEMLRYEARRLRLPILYDIDDPLFSVSAYETYGNMAEVDPGMKAHFLREAPKYLAMMNGADVLSLSTPGLAEHAALYSNRPIFLRRNFADAKTLKAGTRARTARVAEDGLFRIAFASGSQGHEADLATIAPVLEAFLAGGSDRRLMLLGHVDLKRLPGALADKAEVAAFSTYDKYLAALARADVAVMPLADDIFNRCKSAVRVIDAASVSVPAIVGPVGDLPQMIRDGETGVVADGPAAWAAALEMLSTNKGQAAAMGRAARTDLETRWTGQAADHIISPGLIDWVRG